MNKQEIIDEIRKLAIYASIVKSPEKFFKNMQGHGTELSLVLSAFDIADNAEIIATSMEQQLTGGWIPVSSGRLPEDGAKILITIGNEAYRAVRWEGWWYVYYPYGQRCESHVVAWMPLPEPWKEGTNETT